ncbi:MAG TPA: radical SAM family heme chaperone HemW [Nitrospirae bacterium]|nr:radical SAM family heme chaperone HemW [Nitrospirota bacterium]
MPNSLYVHIPFCLKRCVYCDFVSGIYSPDIESSYIAALKKEILNINQEITMSTLYIGGGTPSVLSSDVLTDLVIEIFNNFEFREYFEATIEVNPGTLSSEKIQAVRPFGINRVSIGVQSFDDSVLKSLGRIHTAGDSAQAVSIAGNAGFKNISVDLLYGVPGQSLASWEETLKKTVELKPQHVSTYELTVEEGTLLYDRIKAGKLRRPEEERIVEMYDYAVDYLSSQGYVHYEICNFALPGFSCKHNLNYWDSGEYFGAGLGAHSFVDNKRFYNTDDINKYISALSDNESTVVKTEEITKDKAVSEAFYLGLRKTDGINLSKISAVFDMDIFDRYKKEIEETLDAGLIERYSSATSKDDYLRLTRKGLLLSNEVFLKFV